MNSATVDSSPWANLKLLKLAFSILLSDLAAMKYLVWCLVGLLLILHQDYWQWNKADLVFGFLPYSLAYHMGISLGAAAVWVLAVKHCWPRQVDEVEPDLADGDTKS